MKKRIYITFIIIILLCALLITLSVSMIVSNTVKNREMETVRDRAVLLADLLNRGIGDTGYDHMDFENYAANIARMTIIAPDGKVLIDNKSKASDMGNHSDRDEFISAIQTGSGEITRHSYTLGTETYYYALLLDNGNVLRVSKTMSSIGGVFADIIPAIIVVTIIVMLIAILLAARLTRSIVRPLDEIDFDNDNTAIYDELVPFIRKIEKQKREIDAQLDAQNESEKQRREFSANVSHELKTPLTSISALSEMIVTGMAKDDDIKNFAERINEQAKRLIDIIEDIIKLSEFDEGTARMENTEFDLYQLAETIAESLYDKAGNIDINVIGERFNVVANRRMIDELLYNLIDNSIKYNREDGDVTVRLSHDNEMYTIDVIDTGIGIPAEHQDRIFERFYRVDKSRSKKTGGTGLGLSIVKHIAEYHGGTVKLKSEEGKGTTISCKLPFSLPLNNMSADDN